MVFCQNNYFSKLSFLATRNDLDMNKYYTSTVSLLPPSASILQVPGPPLDLEAGLEDLEDAAEVVHLVPVVHRHAQGREVVCVRGGEGVGLDTWSS